MHASLLVRIARSTAAALAAGCASFAFALPAGSAAEGSRDIGNVAAPVAKLANVVFGPRSVLQAACGRLQVTGTFSVDGTTNDGGGIDQGAVTVYDDGVLIGGATFGVPVGQNQTFFYDITVTHTVGSPGIAFAVREFLADPAAVAFYSETEVATATCPALREIVTLAGPSASVPVPVLGPVALLLLLGTLGGFGAAALRRRR